MYLEYKNVSNQKKEYNQSPESYISILDLSIRTPAGILSSNINDVLEIYSIFAKASDINALTITDTLVIQTNTFFNANEFRANDLIKFSNYVYHNMSFDESGMFNNWINATGGHYIININKSNNTTTLYNQIRIPLPATLSRTTGTFIVEPWFIEFITKSFSTSVIQATSGKLININTQTHLVVNINTIEKIMD